MSEQDEDPRARKLRREAGQRAAAVKLREDGYTYSQIAEQLGITRRAAMAKSRSAREAPDE